MRAGGCLFLYLAQCQRLFCFVVEKDLIVWIVSQLVFDETEQVFLVHTAGVMDVSIDFADVVKVAVGYRDLFKPLLACIEDTVQLEPFREEEETEVRERSKLGRVDDRHHTVKITCKLLPRHGLHASKPTSPRPNMTLPAAQREMPGERHRKQKTK